MPKTIDKLTPKQSTAAKLYTDPGSPSYNHWGNSYLGAGYTKCTGWESNAHRLLHNDKVQKFIYSERDRLTRHIDISRGEIVNGLRKIAITSSTSTKDSDKVAAFKLLSQIKGLLVDVTKDISDQRDLLTPAQQIEQNQKQIKLLQDADKAGVAVAV